MATSAEPLWLGALRTASAMGSLIPSLATGMGVWAATGDRRRAVNTMASLWADVGTALAGVDLRVEGAEHVEAARPAVFLLNHQSDIDALLACALLRRDFVGVAKREIQRHPIFGPAFQMAGTVFIDRADSRAAVRALEPAVETLRSGISIVIFPEGTRSADGRLGPFKKGAFRMAMEAGVPIVPVVIRNSSEALPRGSFASQPATIDVVVCPAVSTAEWSAEGLEAHIDSVRDQFVETLSQAARSESESPGDRVVD